MKTTVVIPAYNEEQHIQDVVSNIPRRYPVIVVDDGSTDMTARRAKKTRARVLRFRTHRGKTAACLAGASASRTPFCIFMDGDGQHNPRNISRIERSLNTADIVLGTRTPSQIPFARRCSNFFATFLINAFTNQTFDDVLCGFRGVRTHTLARLDVRSKGYAFEIALVLAGIRCRARFAAVPVHVTYATGSRMPIRASMQLGAYLISELIKNPASK